MACKQFVLLCVCACVCDCVCVCVCVIVCVCVCVCESQDLSTSFNYNTWTNHMTVLHPETINFLKLIHEGKSCPYI